MHARIYKGYQPEIIGAGSGWGGTLSQREEIHEVSLTHLRRAWYSSKGRGEIRLIHPALV